jgi:hypothetical protein
MIKFLDNEEWHTLDGALGVNKIRYAFSNYGRIASFKKEIKNGKTLKGSLTAGYPAIRVRLEDGTKKLFYIHRLMAKAFLQNAAPDETIVIHLDHMKQNNHISNLKWATQRDKELHQLQSPFFLEGVQKRRDRKTVQGHKLSAQQVYEIKEILTDPRRPRMKSIAKDFGISEMQLYRIKSGENWGHVKLGEPLPVEQKA